MGVINEDGVDTKKYCIECKWERHEWGTSNYPKCSHLKHRQPKNYSHRETDYERYSFGSHANPYGNCVLWEPRRNLVRDIRIIVSEWWKGFKKGSWWY